MAHDSDDLEELLRQNLKLRRQLGAQVAKAKDSSASPFFPNPSKPIRRLALWSATSIQKVATPFRMNEASTPDPFHRRGAGKPSDPSVGDFQAAPDNNEVEAFRRKLTLGRLIAAAEYSGANHFGEGPVCSESISDTLSDDEDLGELRRQLKLRCESMAERTKADDSSDKHSYRLGYSLGWALYSTCLAMAAVSAVLMLRLKGEWHFDDGALIAAGLSAFLFCGLGRDFLYALSRWGCVYYKSRDFDL